MIRLERAYLPDDSATFGRLVFPDGWACFTLENPWKANTVRLSCIPEGIYTLRLRASPVVDRTSGGEFTEGWEVTDVPERTYIMIHPGNWEHNTEGCILPGQRFSWHGEHGPMVTNSRSTFRALMERLAERETWELDVRAVGVGYP